MIVTTTSISISVTPARAFLLWLMKLWFSLNCDIVDACYGEQHAQDQRAHDQAHYQDHEGLEQRRKSLDRGAGFFLINVRHTREHRIESARLFADREQVRCQRRKHMRAGERLRDSFTALHTLRNPFQRIRHAAIE